jgi:hypothetical protein
LFSYIIRTFTTSQVTKIENILGVSLNVIGLISNKIVSTFKELNLYPLKWLFIEQAFLLKEIQLSPQKGTNPKDLINLFKET